MRQRVYLGLDAHTRHCVLAGMDTRGKLLFSERLPTSEAALISHIVAIKARKKLLALEESSLADWLHGELRPYVDELIVCDPRHNALISRSSHKDDREDAYKLCRLLRLGELKPVYHSDQAHRAIFKESAQLYLDLRNQQVGQKNRIKAKYHKAGVLRLDGARVFDAKHRERYLEKLPDDARRTMLSHLYAVLDAMQAAQQAARRDMIRLGAKYSEIKEFTKIPGIGPIGAHVFDAFIQTPHRFASKQKLWKYSKLAVVDRSSAGKPLAYKRLDKAGVGELKAMSHRAFHSAVRCSGSNEVSRFYEAALARTNGDATHARLNTQRKILTAMWTIWRKDVAYNPDRFYPSTPTAAAVCQAA